MTSDLLFPFFLISIKLSVKLVKIENIFTDFIQIFRLCNPDFLV